MTTLTDASSELFARSPDETFESMQAIYDACQESKSESQVQWVPPDGLVPDGHDTRLRLGVGGVQHELTDWSFGQVCRLAGVSKDTINRLSPRTASHALAETLPRGGKPLQVLSRDRKVRAVHPASYTRLHDIDLLSMVREFATDFEPPQKGIGGATGLYRGEQDMFIFLIDPAGWVEIDGEAFAPGFFLWNSEVGKRSVGIKTFWFQAVCQNHIVWDATEVVEYSRKHTAGVEEALPELRRHLHALVEKRDARRDGFVEVIRKAMRERLGEDQEDALKVLAKHGVTRTLAKDALGIAEAEGRLTIFAVVDALTRLAGRMKNAGDRTDVDEKASSLLALAS